MNKTVRYFRRLPYRRLVERVSESDGSSYFVARIAEIPAIRIDGADREEALLKLDEVFDDFIAAMIENGDEIPEPRHFADWDPQASTAPVAVADARKGSSGNRSVVMPQSTHPWQLAEKSTGVLVSH
jgi:predicted RNase H-like HicB family nuclease